MEQSSQQNTLPAAPVAAASAEPAGTAARYRLTLTALTSMLIVTQRRSRVFTGSVAQLESAYRRTLQHNLALGWWGIPFGVIWTGLALARNRKALAALRELAGAAV